jgi:hypothetical protein
VLLSQAGAHIALDVLELAELPLAPSANGETEAEAFEGCFVNPITRYGEAEALTTELVFIGQQMPETEIRAGWITVADNTVRLFAETATPHSRLICLHRRYRL